MAKVGYIFLTPHDDALATDKAWMDKYGCIQIIEEEAEHEKLRPLWHQLIANLERGDELVIVKLSNALRSTRELALFLELCRVKVIRIISLRDKIDSKDELFPAASTSQVLNAIGSLAEEVATLRRASSHVINLKQNIVKPVKVMTNQSKEEREKMIVAMYNGNHSIDDIWRMSGFNSRSSVFRILNKYGVNLNRGKFSGPLGKRKKKD